MTTTSDHHCPGCGANLPFYDRYPWHFCGNCVSQAVDASGRCLVFGNASFSGGLRWAYAGHPEAFDDGHLRVACLIAGRPVLVQEARFGGVVAQPLVGERPPPPGTLDLTKPRRSEPAVEVPSALPEKWYDYIVGENVRLDRPGIYEWRIAPVDTDQIADVYIGKYTSISRPTREYERNIGKLLGGRGYRLSNPEGFRRIHRELAKAVAERRRITLTILENVDPADLNRRERELIVERGTLNGAAPAEARQEHDGLDA